LASALFSQSTLPEYLGWPAVKAGDEYMFFL